MPLATADPSDIGWWGDASTSFGIGVVIGKYWGVWKWAPGFEVGPKKSFDIGWAEAVAVEMGLRLALRYGLFKSEIQNHSRTFLVRSDNSGVVGVLRKGRSRSRETNKILKHVYQLQARERIRLTPHFVPTESNISDSLSRGEVARFLAAFPAASRKASVPLPVHLQGKLISW
jgi:hypothetical protein